MIYLLYTVTVRGDNLCFNVIIYLDNRPIIYLNK